MFRLFRKASGVSDLINYKKTFFYTDEGKIHYVFRVAIAGEFSRGYISFDEQEFNERYGDIIIEFEN